MKKTIRIIIICILIILIAGAIAYKVNTDPVGTDDTIIRFVVDSGDTYYSIAPKLKEAGLIKSELFYKLYIKMHDPSNLQAGKYPLAENMSLAEILVMFETNSTYNPDAITITFPEGINMNRVAEIIANNTDNSEESVYELLKDNDFLDEIILKYWFLSDDIKNKNLYYSLEGYLFPNTYEFSGKDVSVNDIFLTMLNETDRQLTPFKEDIQSSEYSMHELLTLASIVELEAWNSEDRAVVAGVFYNRLNSGWALGSCVTTYYASKVQMGERDLYQSELDAYNDYNTRSSKMTGKLPIGPICNPSIDSIKAALYPTESEYYYFVSDKNKKLYFSKTYTEHEKTISELQSQGLWLEY
jgi:UPF0755 protein